MKTRELLTCDVRTFARKIQTLKVDELQRHVERVARELGVADAGALTEQVVRSVFDAQDLPEDGGEEMRRVLRVLESHMLLTADNEDRALRLVALMGAYLRTAVRRAAREERLAARHARTHGHPHHHACDDPACADPDHEHHHPH
jgi:hypothetical protein